MVSPCPNCKTEVTHEDYQFEVECQCGMRFNPFYDANLVESAGAGGENQFAEATNAFKEIVAFGEGKEVPAPAKTKTSESSGPKPIPKQAPAAKAQPAQPLGDEILMTTGSALHGYQVDGYVSPLSVAFSLEIEMEDPLRPGFQGLWQTCLKRGGNAVLDVAWAFTPDGSRCVVTGTAVRCSKG